MIANQEAGLWRKVKNPKKNQQQWENKEFNLKGNYFLSSGILQIVSKESEIFDKKKADERAASALKRKAEKAKSDAANLKGF